MGKKRTPDVRAKSATIIITKAMIRKASEELDRYDSRFELAEDAATSIIFAALAAGGFNVLLDDVVEGEPEPTQGSGRGVVD